MQTAYKPVVQRQTLSSKETLGYLATRGDFVTGESSPSFRGRQGVHRVVGTRWGRTPLVEGRRRVTVAGVLFFVIILLIIILLRFACIFLSVFDQRAFWSKQLVFALTKGESRA